MKFKENYTFDDVLLVPQYSEITSRSQVNTSVKIKEHEFAHPIIPANMKTIIGYDMADVIAGSKGLAILHRFSSIEKQVKLAYELVNKHSCKYIAASIGAKENEIESVKRFYDVGVRIICIDIAHGDSKMCTDMIKAIKLFKEDILIIAGNVATGQAAGRLWDAGADVVKVGIGAGAICTTRVEAASGVPQLSAIIEVANFRDEYYKLHVTSNKHFISDGGLKTPGDICKALCFADMVMAGNMFSGCTETPGTVIEIHGSKFKDYHGSSTHKHKHVEGVKAMVQVKGSYQNVLEKILDGITSCCSYQGVDNLTDLKENPQFVKITSAALKESGAHDVILK